MAKIELTNELGGFKYIGDLYNWNLTLNSSSVTEVRFTDDNGFQIVVFGTGLTVTGDALSGGTVTAVQLLDDSDAVLVNVTEGNFSASDLDTDSIWKFMSVLSAGNDTIIAGDTGIDMNFGSNHGNDALIAGDGGSFMSGSKGKDSYSGGADWDILSYEIAVFQRDAKLGIVLNTGKAVAIDAWGDKDTFSAIEEYRGTGLRDKFIGSGSEDEAFMGMAGKDIINGGKGWDEVRYHRDQAYGGDSGILANLAKGFVKDGFGDKDKVTGVEVVYGTYFDDKFIGDAKDNWFRGIDGIDTFNGGKGWDTVNFDWWENLGQTGVTVDMSRATGQIVDDGFGNTETVKSIEEIDGSNMDDVITLGGSGRSAWGNGGDDTLTAGAAGNWFRGGDGADKFVFATASAVSSPGVNGVRSYIDDFSQGESDKVDLAGIGGLTFIGSAQFSGVEGELRFEIVDGNTFLRGDVDGNGQEDLTLEFGGSITFVANDLVL